MKYYIGVDGGGTKTEIIVCDVRGNVVARTVGTGCNPNDIGKAKMVETLNNLLAKTLPIDCQSADIGLGISGIATDGGEEYLKEYLRCNPLFKQISVKSDKDSCMDCAHENDGVIAIMGTGNVLLARKGRKTYQIAGGGYLLGDGLSGFDLGRGLLNALLFEEDGRGEKTVLTSLFEERVGENIRAHLKKVYEKGKAYIASFSDLVFKGIELEDKVAKGILQEAVKEFETSLHTAYRLMEQEKCEVALFGGLTKQFEKINAFFAQETKEKFIFTIPQNPIVYGLLKEFIPKEEREEFKKNLRVGYYENR